MSLLNSASTEYLIEAQAAGARAVKTFNLEPIPLGYLVVGESKTAVRRVGRAIPIPFARIDLAVNYALAAQYLGMRFIYLEAGSGATEPVDERMINKVSGELNIPVIVGGGIKTASQAERLAKAGASAIVTGTVLEREGPERVKEILGAIRRAQ
jgi:phosphoglycerol geranylgeranyltransferase